MKHLKPPLPLLLLAGFLAGATGLLAAPATDPSETAAPARCTAEDPGEEDEIIELEPFTVEVSEWTCCGCLFICDLEFDEDEPSDETNEQPD